MIPRDTDSNFSIRYLHSNKQGEKDKSNVHWIGIEIVRTYIQG